MSRYGFQGRRDQGYTARRSDSRAGDDPGYDDPGYDDPGYGRGGYAGGRGYARAQYGVPRRGQNVRYAEQPTRLDLYERDGYVTPDSGPFPAPGGVRPGSGGPRRSTRGGRPGSKGRGRLRRFFRLRTVRGACVLLLVFFVWVAFSAGQALTAPTGGSASSKLAEWARDHYLGPVITFGEWLTYSPPKAGGKPSFSLAVPKGESIAARPKAKTGFQPVIPATLASLAGKPLAGEGQWRVLEKVKGEPAIFGTFLRDATYTRYVNGIVSMDQRLVKFQLHPGAEDPGGSGWGPNAQPWIPPGDRTGLLATFNGGFKLDSAQGGFYLNGRTARALKPGAASIVYYKNGTIKIGVWDQTVRMTPQVAGVRQNLKLIVDNGKVPASVNSNVETNWGATLGGGYFVWRSGIGITRDGRIIFVYGPALNVQDLADLLQRAGAVEGMQLDINPFWMSYEYYSADGHPADPTPANLLPTQQQTAYRYYSPYSRDFTAVFAR